MELIVGKNSYMTMEEVNELVSELFISSDNKRVLWESMDDNDKGVYILRATKEVNNNRLLYKGRKLDELQSMQFPRVMSLNNSVQVVECPEDIKMAIIEIAINKVMISNSEEMAMIKKGITSFSDGGGLSIHFNESLINNSIQNINEDIFNEYIRQYTQIV